MANVPPFDISEDAPPPSTVKIHSPEHLSTKPAAAVLPDFRTMFKMTPEEEAEHERDVAKRLADKRAHEQAIALKEWEQICPPRLQHSDWNHPGIAPYRAQINQMLSWKRSGQGIYAVGWTGKGKTRAAWALARRLAVDELVPIRYLLQGEVMNEVNRNGLDAWLEKVARIKRAPVIFWDDFGNFAAMGSRAEILATELFGLFDFRFNHELPVIATSNAREAELRAIFGPTRSEPLFRRISEGSTVIDFDNK